MTSDKPSRFFPWKRISLHVLFWLFYVLFFGLIYGKYGNDYGWYFFESLCMLPFIMITTYTTIYGILPFYLKKRKLFLSVLFVVVLIFTAVLCERIFLRVINSLPITFDTLFGITFLYLILETNFMVGIAFAIKTVQKWLVQQNEKHEMEKKNLETELSLLKSQLHPHFLFNTMNNLYALSLEQSSKTSEGIAKLSALLRSVLYECNEKEIPLAKEIELLGNYIDLEEIRYDNLININFEISGEVDKVKIAPMLLFTFAENCFKHSDIKQNEEHYIKMKVVVNRNKFDFYAENSKLPGVEVGRSKKEGIGLNNVSKRLELIYPGKHSLKMTNLETKFIVRLSINLL